MCRSESRHGNGICEEPLLETCAAVTRQVNINKTSTRESNVGMLELV